MRGGERRLIRWSDEEIQRLREIYPTTTNEELKTIFGRTRGSIFARARRLGLRKIYPAREKVKSLRYEHPDWTLGAIGREIGVSREWVRQILSSESLPTRASKERPKCLYCGNPLQGRKRYCSEECKKNFRWVTLTCSFCGKEFRRSRRDARLSYHPSRRKGYTHENGTRVRFFCDRKCLAKWMVKVRKRRVLKHEKAN